MEGPGDQIPYLQETDEEIHPVDDSVWKLLVVDDDEDIHRITELILSDLLILDRPLKILHAFSRKEALSVFGEESDIAVILLDVVMETEDAGLEFVRDVRETFGNRLVQIILRTGYPGYAPEKEVIQKYDINDYKEKTELTQLRMTSSLISAVRTYSRLREIHSSRRGLRYIIDLSPVLQTCEDRGAFLLLAQEKLSGLLSGHFSSAILEKDSGHCRIVSGTGIYTPGEHENFRQLIQEGKLGIDDLDLVESACDTQQNSYTSQTAVIPFWGQNNLFFIMYIRSNRSFTATDRQLLDVYSLTLKAGLSNVMLMERLKTTAYTDLVTDLPNRLRFLDHLEHRLRRNEEGSLVVLDLDGFSSINDAFGYETGDRILKTVGERLRKRFPESIYVARLSGDTFGLFGRGDFPTPDELLNIFMDPVVLDKTPFPVRATLGLVSFSRVGGRTAQEQYRDAVMAMKRAKVSAGSRYAWYTPEMETETRERLNIVRELRKALDAASFHISYHPQVDIRTHKVLGLESLIRWRRDDGFLVSPAIFIPVAESSGLISEIGEFVFDGVFRQIASWRELGMTPVPVAINVSVQQFHDPEFLERLENRLSGWNIPPSLIELEITESMVMKDTERVIFIMNRIRKMGISLAVDDFGTGFSSLGYLQKLPVNRLKIDRSFIENIVEDPRSRTIAKMIVNLGRELGLTVLAEGIQTEQQADYLLSIGCTEAQGFFYSRPMMSDEIPDWLLNFS
jgi:diguanylate cyclase (GGDEF)-like protein